MKQQWEMSDELQVSCFGTEKYQENFNTHMCACVLHSMDPKLVENDQMWCKS
jgi:hypothetical protein